MLENGEADGRLQEREWRASALVVEIGLLEAVKVTVLPRLEEACSARRRDANTELLHIALGALDDNMMGGSVCQLKFVGTPCLTQS